MKKKINSIDIINAVSDACIECACILNKSTYNYIKEAINSERNETAKYVINELISNADIAKQEQIPICQDTGMVLCFVELGINIDLDKPIKDSINKGISKGYIEGYLRKSIVKDPFNRINTNDNTPGIVYIEQNETDILKINIMLKGFGSENMSFVKMLNPSILKDDVTKIISEEICKRAHNACPPIFVGIGIGGTIDFASVLSKKALLRPAGQKNADENYAEMENNILKYVNKSNIGPAGYTGDTTALSVAIEAYPTHIASLPVAVTIQCHAFRHKEIIL
ncbi:MAG TPA: fumarate hydratase [Clostridia bacterium]|jgi:fumarate hydratase subunit alpha|nr:MAG: L(+)-tartrate dehydratase subunit alpha [Firmicutes bacterium ADurb.Bin146]HOD92711.1 fumarate hydratase [Clostridia bacterium]